PKLRIFYFRVQLDLDHPADEVLADPQAVAVERDEGACIDLPVFAGPSGRSRAGLSVSAVQSAAERRKTLFKLSSEMIGSGCRRAATMLFSIWVPRRTLLTWELVPVATMLIARIERPLPVPAPENFGEVATSAGASVSDRRQTDVISIVRKALSSRAGP